MYAKNVLATLMKIWRTISGVDFDFEFVGQHYRTVWEGSPISDANVLLFLDFFKQHFIVGQNGDIIY